ncbi:hypothetical protein [Puniceicoccus vermicola]|uniref:hypothetical protein n=1 Tax=Puniceicoccus vermicola TaxID=388746 RepID=UPI001639C574|nr:hypothetical protein [Puniceicoccus vermicola]
MASILTILKDIFFLVGAIAGLLALFRQFVESKFKKDLDRLNSILSKFSASEIMDLEYLIGGARKIPDSVFSPFENLAKQRKISWNEVCFTGPLRKEIQSELECLDQDYLSLREFIQTPHWDGSNWDFRYYWTFEKNSFSELQGKGSYPEHLKMAEEAAERLRKRFQRVQALADLHFYQAIASGFTVPRLFRARGLEL